MTYAIDDGDGNEICTGLDEHIAHRTAQELANKRGEAVYLYAVEEGESGKYETIEPERA